MTMLQLPEVLKTVHALPPLPAVLLDLLASMQQEDVDTDTLARKIALDQVLTAKTLRLANSSFYGMPRQITTAVEAISVLGLYSVRNLAITAALVEALPNREHVPFQPLVFWRHAIGTALCARALARQMGLNHDQAYVAGLLHDIGRLVLATRYPGPYALVLEQRAATDCFMVEAERTVLGLDHAMVGAALAQHWKFPALVQQAVAQHHAPESPGAQDMTLVVHAADATAHALDFSADDNDLVPPVAPAAWQRLGLDESKLVAVLQDAERQFEAACVILTP